MNNAVLIVVQPNKFQVDPPFDRQVTGGFEDFLVGINWDQNDGAWNRVVVRNFNDGTKPVATSPSELVFTAAEKNTVKKLQFDPVGALTNVKYDVVYENDHTAYTVDPTLLLKPF
jgi:hypothetical protein